MVERVDSLYWIDTGWGCGAIITNELGCIIKTAPIFKKFKGQDIDHISKTYRTEYIKDNKTVEEDFF